MAERSGERAAKRQAKQERSGLARQPRLVFGTCWSRVIESNPDRSWCRQFLLPSAVSPHSFIICPHLDQASNDHCRGQPVRGGRIADDTPETLGSVREVPRRRVNRTFGPLHAPTSSRFDANPECRFQDGSASRHDLKRIRLKATQPSASFPAHRATREGLRRRVPRAAVSVLLGRSAGGHWRALCFSAVSHASRLGRR
jgi:hypothetical protein